MNRTLRANCMGLCAAVAVTVCLAGAARAHCDTMSGPVVSDAKQALEKQDVTPALKWVAKDQEESIRAAFQKTLKVRQLSPEAAELADRYFFETLVRIHRAGEGAPYTGLKDTPPEMVIAEADKALDKGSVDELAAMVAQHAAEGVRQKFQVALEKKKHAGDSVEAGREYVAAYVEYTHYLEGLHKAATQESAHSAGEPAAHAH